MIDFVSHRYVPDPQLCDHEWDACCTWKDKIYFKDDLLMVRIECVRCGAESWQEYLPGKIMEEE
jgi:hypothetical protein